MDFLSDSYFALFLIIAIGFILGRIKIRGISLDVSAVIFVALVFGHNGVFIPQDFQQLGLVLFIFTIGIQAGPGFFQSFKKNGRQLAVIAIVLVLSSGVIAFLIIHFAQVDRSLAIGLLTGALTSTPGLAAAIDATGSSLSSIGYGIAYPFGVIGVILYLAFLPKILRIDIKNEEAAYLQDVAVGYPNIHKKNFIVENESVNGKSIGELQIREMTGAVISRVMHQEEAIAPSSSTILKKGDIVKAVGSEKALENVQLLIGRETTREIPLSNKYDVRSVLVTNREVAGKSLGQLNLHAFGATITRIRRSGIEMTPSESFKLQLGDKLVVACPKDGQGNVIRILGDDDRHLSDTDFLPIATGIILGILVGKLSIGFESYDFSLGLTGGILLTALFLGKLGRTGPFMWTMTGAANHLLRQLGLLFFLASVGTSAGASLEDTYSTYGMGLFAHGVAITLLPLLLATLIAKIFFKMNLLTLLGTLAGSMTSTPGLAMTDALSDTDASAVAYATVYPIAMVLLIVLVKILASIDVAIF